MFAQVVQVTRGRQVCFYPANFEPVISRHAPLSLWINVAASFIFPVRSNSLSSFNTPGSASGKSSRLDQGQKRGPPRRAAKSQYTRRQTDRARSREGRHRSLQNVTAPAVASSGGALSLIATRPSGAAITVSAPLKELSLRRVAPPDVLAQFYAPQP